MAERPPLLRVPDEFAREVLVLATVQRSMSDIRERVAGEHGWYHTFDLPGGGTTHGLFDLRKVPARLPLPPSLVGKRCLDAASADGFFAFEFARRGADEVVSLDLDDPGEKDWQGTPGTEQRHQGMGAGERRFHVIRDAYEADNAKRVSLNLYDITPEAIGTFDFVFLGNVMLHLADPVRALRALRSVVRPGGEFFSFEQIQLVLSVLSPKAAMGSLWDTDERSRWWTPNMAGHRRLVEAAGFDIEAHGGPVFSPFGSVMPRRPKKMPRTFRQALFWATSRWTGAPGQWIRATPRALPA